MRLAVYVCWPSAVGCDSDGKDCTGDSYTQGGDCSGPDCARGGDCSGPKCHSGGGGGCGPGACSSGGWSGSKYDGIGSNDPDKCTTCREYCTAPPSPLTGKHIVVIKCRVAYVVVDIPSRCLRALLLLGLRELDITIIFRIQEASSRPRPEPATRRAAPPALRHLPTFGALGCGTAARFIQLWQRNILAGKAWWYPSGKVKLVVG
ncbi:hypothetical protein B0T24DRAFT_670402 [Lasiosphaeria ovina]|uniref:Uncharacterized protein n=1 Tax=Lasiosphaeria ovina TaxID=92902 RepID=A0AAE0MZL8_9PEZI|nr:hypothetical protein B0T24DRAFT_670402 [Lasiosphaeria ovina]